jgi:CspA family cold shock protein
LARYPDRIREKVQPRAGIAQSRPVRLGEGKDEGMATGTVKWFNDEKGYGFITPDEGDRDLFVHHTGVNGSGFKTLQENAKVSYDEEAGDKGPKAVNVTKL